MVESGLAKLRPTPDRTDEIIEPARQIARAGIGIYTLFFPVWNFAKYLISSREFSSLKEIDEETAIRWLTKATASKRPSTAKSYKIALVDFFNYLSRHNEERFVFDVRLNQWRRSLSNSIKTKTPAFLNADEVKLFLAGLYDYEIKRKPRGRGAGGKEKVDEYSTLLYRLAFRLALATGARVSELLAIQARDIAVDKKTDTATITIRSGKGGKTRRVVVPYGEGRLAIGEDLERYLSARGRKHPATSPLLCGKSGRPISRYTLDKAIREYLGYLGIKKEKSGMHLLRHTHATLFYEATSDLLLLQDRLGHEDPMTTKRYTHLEEEKVRRSANALR